MVSVHVEIDQSSTYAMVETFEGEILNAERFAANEIEHAIRYDIFRGLVHRLGARAGEGFPPVYRDHLANFMVRNVPINIDFEGEGILIVEFDLDNLGDYTDLEAGAHHKALIYEEPGATYGFTGKGKAKYNPHPAQVDLPYAGQDLMNDAGRRQEFWEQAIVGQEGFITNFRRGGGFLEIHDAPTFEDVAAARVFEAWVPMGVAPEWLWLENGFTESEPRIYPVDFIYTLESAALCVSTSIYEGVLLGLIEVAEAAGGAIGVGSRGRPFQRASGQFVPYRQAIDFAIPDVSHCLGDI